MTIKDILEKVDLFNITTEDEEGMSDAKKDKEMKANLAYTGQTSFKTNKAGKTIINTSDSSSAYLGPKLWDNAISLNDLADEDYGEVINMDKFLSENNLLSSPSACSEMSEPSVVVSPPHSTIYETEVSTSPLDQDDYQDEYPEVKDIKIPQRPSIFAHTSGQPDMKRPLEEDEKSFLYVESKRAKIEREKEERRRKFEEEINFSPEDLALATVPGRDFDPRNRAFDLEELRPQPIIRKRKKTAVPDEMKDDKYWEKRAKNKLATRRSREARRLKENQIALRAAFLEKENKLLKKQLEDAQFETVKLRNETDILKQKLLIYEGGN